MVGDVIKVNEGEYFPCDVVLLSSSLPAGKANIMTANLDGETNLKVHSATALTKSCVDVGSLTDLAKQGCWMECEGPNANLTRFNGRLKLRNEVGQGPAKSSSLSLDNVALRGVMLKNTDWIYGTAVYTGADTKMSMNSKITRNKFSTVEKSMNRYLIFFLILLAFEVVVATVLKYTIGVDRPKCKNDVPWYLGTEEEVCEEQVAQDMLSFLVLFNYIIPISLYVTLELQKFFGSFFLTWDVELYDEETDTPAKCNSSDLNEELGQVEYLFSDKTGTLTENVMRFKECSIDGVRMHNDGGAQLAANAGEQPASASKVKRFLEVVSLCHTAVSDISQCQSQTDTAAIVYSAASPDEKALVEACRDYGVAFLGEKEVDGEVTLKLMLEGDLKQFVRLRVLEFDSDRKRMSVVIKDKYVRMLTCSLDSDAV